MRQMYLYLDFCQEGAALRRGEDMESLVARYATRRRQWERLVVYPRIEARQLPVY